jgi:glycosyltransferase involved in cell wall biosynthesis
MPPNPPGSDIEPGISVVVPVRNGAETITDCLTAILRQDYPRDRFEVVVVDNGSTDDTIARVKALGSAIIMIEEARRGPSAARNAGVAAATHPLIAFTDSDCFPEAGWLHAFAEHHRAQPDVVFVGGPIRPRDPDHPAERYAENLFAQERCITHAEWPFAITANMMIAKRRLETIGLFNEQCLLGEDVELSYRGLLDHGATFAFAADAAVRHANPRSHRAIFRKGVQHGRSAAFLLRRFEGVIPASSFGGWSIRELRRLIRLYAASLVGGTGGTALFEALYRTGKLIGIAAGPLRPPQ